ncbi:hypothetical protein EDC04DRAFT_2679743 [Pisolithus marmoratus]|nr:hypothetical protein EDC04DRAFT_2679743 [Pisolithus marmoratus]
MFVECWWYLPLDACYTLFSCVLGAMSNTVHSMLKSLLEYQRRFLVIYPIFCSWGHQLCFKSFERHTPMGGKYHCSRYTTER